MDFKLQSILCHLLGDWALRFVTVLDNQNYLTNLQTYCARASVLFSVLKEINKNLF
jgi:hypothetical protein